MAEAILSLRVLETQIHPTRLEILEVRAARHFQIRVLSRRPDFDVVSLGRAKTEIARAKFDHAIVQAEQLQHALRVRRQRFMFRVGSFRRRDFHQLHLVELMHANDAARLASGRTRFAPKTRRVGDKFLRQLRGRENFFAMKIRHRHFRRRREEHLVFLQPVHVFLKLRQLRRADHAIAPDQKTADSFPGNRARAYADRA